MSWPLRNIMTAIQSKRMCSAVAVIGLASLLTADALVNNGRFDLNIGRDGLALLLIAWLFTGAELARWIVCVLSGVTSLICVGLALLFATHWRQFHYLTHLQVISFVFCAVGLAAFVLVTWRLATLSNEGRPHSGARSRRRERQP